MPPRESKIYNHKVQIFDNALTYLLFCRKIQKPL